MAATAGAMEATVDMGAMVAPCMVVWAQCTGRALGQHVGLAEQACLTLQQLIDSSSPTSLHELSFAVFA